MADVFARVRAGGGGGALQPKTLVGDQGAHHRGGFACGSADPGGARLVLVEGKPPFGRTGAPPPPHTHSSRNHPDPSRGGAGGFLPAGLAEEQGCGGGVEARQLGLRPQTRREGRERVVTTRADWPTEKRRRNQGWRDFGFH